MDHDIKTKRPAPVSTIIPLVVVLLMGQYFAPLLQYDRSAIIAGEYWRVLTCHFVHAGWEHMLLNMLGALLILFLFVQLYAPFAWLTGIFCSMIGISTSLLLIHPTLEWYMGLSGILHGLLMMGIIGEIKKGNWFYYFGLAAIVGKLAMEYFSGPSDITSRFIDISIITSAHLSGAITGGLIACFVAFRQKQTGGLAAAPAAQPACLTKVQRILHEGSL